MKELHGRQTGSFERVQYFLRHWAPRDRRVHSMRVELDDVIVRIRGAQPRQVTAKHVIAWESHLTVRLREEIRHTHLRPIVRRGRTLIKNQPGLEEMLTVPHKRASSAAIAEHTLALIEWLKPYRSTFIAHGFARNFLSSARAAAKDLAKRTTNTGGARTDRSTATRSIAEAIVEGTALKEALNAIVKPLISHDARLLAQWESAMRVGKRIGRPKKRKHPKP